MLKEFEFPTIAPSILSADYAQLGKDVLCAEESGAKILHLDVMDGHFVPNITFGPMLIKAIREVGRNMYFDAHLMMSHPLTLIDRFIDAGADCVTVHCECSDDIDTCIDAIKSRGKEVGLSVNPKTSAQALFPYLEKIDLILIMTVEPGFGGQGMIPECLEKIGEIKAEASRRGIVCPVISVDGGVNPATCPMAASAGADVLVAGNAFYSATDRKARFAELISAAAEARKSC